MINFDIYQHVYGKPSKKRMSPNIRITFPHEKIAYFEESPEGVISTDLSGMKVYRSTTDGGFDKGLTLMSKLIIQKSGSCALAKGVNVECVLLSDSVLRSKASESSSAKTHTVVEIDGSLCSIITYESGARLMYVKSRNSLVEVECPVNIHSFSKLIREESLLFWRKKKVDWTKEIDSAVMNQARSWAKEKDVTHRGLTQVDLKNTFFDAGYFLNIKREGSCEVHMELVRRIGRKTVYSGRIKVVNEDGMDCVKFVSK